VAVEDLLDTYRGRERIRRSHEGRHDAITEVLDQPSPIRLDRTRHQAIVLAANHFSRLLAEPGPEFRRADQIREQHDGGGSCRLATTPLAHAHDRRLKTQ
jgi:hypothetical protein